jgi:hypothetical protein
VRWRAENAEARARAEAERERWATRRASSDADMSDPPSAGASSETWESVLRGRHAAGGSPSPVDVRDVVTGEERGPDNAVCAHVADIYARDDDDADPFLREQGPGAPTTQTDASSPRWEDVPSDPSDLASSFPSLSFPDATPEHSKHASGSGSGSGENAHHDHERHDHEHRHHYGAHAESSATRAVFDGALSTRTRLWALVGALGINLLLPFVNGVMLGAGEIFARDVLMGWLGWTRGTGTTGAGLRWRRWRS